MNLLALLIVQLRLSKPYLDPCLPSFFLQFHHDITQCDET